MNPYSHFLTSRRCAQLLSAFVVACLAMMIDLRAATIFVDAQLPTASCGNYDPATRSCGAGANPAYKTIGGAAGVASAGTVVLIRGGSYAEQLMPANSGVAGSPITFQAYPGESVYLTGATAIYLASRSHIVVDGIHAEDTRWVEANNSHYNVIRNCVFKRTPASGTTGNIRFISSHYNRIQNNWLESGQDNVVLIDANYNIVEGNTFREGRHSLLSIRCGDYNVVRSNYFANTLQKIAEIYDCGADTTAVPNSFNSTKHNLFEGNVFADASSYYSTSGGTGLQYSGQEGIVRGNVFYNCNVGLSIAVYADEGLYVNDNSIYNNVFYANDGTGVSMGSAPRNTFKNNVLFGNLGVLPDCFAVSPGQIAYRTSFGSGTLYENNDILYQTAGQPVIEIEFGYGQSIAQFNAANPGIFYNTFEADPQFANAVAHDFRLQSTSPLINAGAFVTQASAAGNGTVLPVLNAGAFYDGHGIPGEAGDVIRLQGQSQTARIVSIDYVNRRLILDQPLSWFAGQGVALNYSGTAPDIGAYEYIESTQPPPDTIAPTVAVTAPENGATISGTAVITAEAADNVGVAGAQLRIDGVNAGPELTAPPYSWLWDTATVTDGSHQILAVARDSAGNNSTSAAILVTVQNVVIPPPPTNNMDTTAPVISGIAVSEITANSATVTWTTDESSDSQVNYGIGSLNLSTTRDTRLVTAHSVRLTGLKARTAYSYRVRSRDVAGNEAISSLFTFQTARHGAK